MRSGFDCEQVLLVLFILSRSTHKIILSYTSSTQYQFCDMEMDIRVLHYVVHEPF